MARRNDNLGPSTATLNSGVSTTAGGRDAGPTGLLNRSVAFRRWCLIAYWLLIFVLTHWPHVQDMPGFDWFSTHFAHFDLVVHFSMYAGWAAMWCWLLAGMGVPIRGRMAGLLAGAAGYAIFDELTQVLVQRDLEIGDWLMDMAGVSATLLVLGWWSRRRSPD